DDDRGGYSVTRGNDRTERLAPGEQAVFEKLFADGPSLALTTANHRRVKAAIAALKSRLALDFEKIYFQRNGRWLIPGLALTVLTLACAVLFAPDTVSALFMAVWLAGWTVGCYFLANRVIALWSSR